MGTFKSFIDFSNYASLPFPPGNYTHKMLFDQSLKGFSNTFQISFFVENPSKRVNRSIIP